MDKKIFSYLGVLVLISFSFYYTDKAVDIIKRNDPVMQKIIDYNSFNKIDPINAYINDSEMMPGVIGRQVNLDESYKNMKRLNKFDESLLVFEEVIPNINLDGNYDKYIVKGNNSLSNVSLVFTISDINNLKQIYDVLLEKNVLVTFFIDGNIIEDNIELILEIARDGYEIENFGYSNQYSEEMFNWTNNLIESITNVSTKYCYSEYHNYKVMDICSKNKKYTIIPSINAVNYPFMVIKSKLENGSIIRLDNSDKVLKELSTSISYIKQKGYDLVTLDELLKESKTEEK